MNKVRVVAHRVPGGMLPPPPEDAELVGHFEGTQAECDRWVQMHVSGARGVVVSSIVMAAAPPAAPAAPPSAAPTPTTAVAPVSSPKLATFLVPTHRRPETLKLALGSIATQVCPKGWNFEIRVVGRHDDPSRELMTGLFGDNPLGDMSWWIDCDRDTAGAKLNDGLKETRGELILLADDDDIQPPSRLVEAVRAHEAGADWGCSGKLWFYHPKEDACVLWEGPASSGLAGTTLSASTSILRRVGGWDPDLLRGKDEPMAQKLRGAGAVFGEVHVQPVCIQHGANLWERKPWRKGESGIVGPFIVTGLGGLEEQGFDDWAAKPLRELRGEHAPKRKGRAFTCSLAGPGQSAFIDGLCSIGFETVSLAEAENVLAEGIPVLFHGWKGPALPDRFPGRVHVLWHSGWTGSDLMGEGETLAAALSYLRQGKIVLWWLDRRDVPPPGARHLVPVWEPKSLEALAGNVEKEPNSIVTGLCGLYPSAAKNLLACLVGSLGTTARVHVGKSAFGGLRGKVFEQLISGKDIVLHDTLDREAAVKLVASVSLLVHVSNSDTWPYLVMEAIHAGTPVLVSDVVAWTEALPDDMREVCVVRPHTASEQIRVKAQRLLDSPELREKLLASQRKVLDELAPVHRREAVRLLSEAGFDVGGEKAGEVEVVEGKKDLTSQVTVFVITTGEPSTQACHEHLEAQDSVFVCKQIHNVTPMWKAFQRMIADCTTPYYVQVDADMLLRPSAIRELHEGIVREKVAQWVGWLWDEDMERPVTGVKIYDRAICSTHPYVESLSCELKHNDALVAAGHRVFVEDLQAHWDVEKVTWREGTTLGRHVASQTPALAFSRWKRLAQKHRKTDCNGCWAPHFHQMLEKWKSRPDDDIAAARLFGCLAGLTGEVVEKEMDASSPDPDYVRVSSYLGDKWDRPLTINVYATDRCNFRCVFDGIPCKRQSTSPPPSSGDIDPWLLGEALKRWPSIKSCCVAGFGEPLLHPRIAELLEIPLKRGLVTSIVTNGSKLADFVDALRGVHVSVSLNAATEREHREISGSLVWPQVLAGVRKAVEQGLTVALSRVCTTSNLGGVADFLNVAHHLGAAFVDLHNALPHDGMTEAFLRDVISVSSGEALSTLETLKSHPFAHLVRNWPTPIDPTKLPIKCSSPSTSVGIDARGNITACSRVDGPSPLQQLHDWPGLQRASILRQITGDSESHPVCRGCFGGIRG